MTARDRLEAISRCPKYLEYQKAMEEYREKSDSAKKLSERPRFPWNPLELVYLTMPPDNPKFDEIREALLSRVFDREAVILMREGQGEWGENGPIPVTLPDALWTWRKNRMYMRLSIDLNKSDKELKECFIKIVNHAKKDMFRDKALNPDVSEGRTARKKREYDPWEIYDLHEKEGVPLLEITHRMTGERGVGKENNPAYNEKLDALNKRIVRAYRQAVRMIQVISAEAGNW